MCGIAGVYNYADESEPTAETVWDMVRAMQHRGPDALCVKNLGPVTLGHARLSIIDLSSSANQPMANEDGSCWIAYNGEFYTFEGFREYLEGKGHVLRTHSDTEVLLHLYEERGSDVVHDIRGMFAFAIWNSRERSMFAARDRFGIKPFYFYDTGKSFIFSSELSSLLVHPQVPREIDESALDCYMALGYTLSPRTLIRGVRRLPPAATLRVTANGVEAPKPYYSPQPFQSPGRTRQDWIECVREGLREAIELRLVADVPVGAFLSGGVDSSAIVAVMREHFSVPVHTFSLDYPEREYSEGKYARKVAEELDTIHHELLVTPQLFVQTLPDVACFQDDPLSDPSGVNNFLVSRLAREHVTVSLSGDGGDEVFGGYDRYVRDARLARIGASLEFARPVAGWLASLFPQDMDTRHDRLRRYGNALARSFMPIEKRYPARFFCFSRESRKSFYRKGLYARVGQSVYVERQLEQWFDRAREYHPFLQKQYFDLMTYIPEDLMLKGDRMSMAHSLEVRVPFLDHVLVEMGMSIPTGLNYDSAQNRKAILKEAVAHLVPREALYRRKRGFGLPYADWLRTEGRELVQDTLLNPESFIARYIRPEKIISLVHAFRSKRFGVERCLWLLFALELWAQSHLCTGTVKTERTGRKNAGCV